MSRRRRGWRAVRNDYLWATREIQRAAADERAARDLAEQARIRSEQVEVCPDGEDCPYQGCIAARAVLARGGTWQEAHDAAYGRYL